MATIKPFKMNPRRTKRTQVWMLEGSARSYVWKRVSARSHTILILQLRAQQLSGIISLVINHKKYNYIKQHCIFISRTYCDIHK